MTTAKEVKLHLRNGDIAKVAELLKMKPNTVSKIMSRPTTGRHKEVLKAAIKVAKSNIKLGL